MAVRLPLFLDVNSLIIILVLTFPDEVRALDFDWGGDAYMRIGRACMEAAFLWRDGAVPDQSVRDTARILCRCIRVPFQVGGFSAYPVNRLWTRLTLVLFLQQ